MKIQNALVLNIPDRSQRYFAHVTTVTLSWRVQNIVVIGGVYITLECFEFSSNFEFDRNMLSGTGACFLLMERPDWPKLHDMFNARVATPSNGNFPLLRVHFICYLTTSIHDDVALIESRYVIKAKHVSPTCKKKTAFALKRSIFFFIAFEMNWHMGMIWFTMWCSCSHCGTNRQKLSDHGDYYQNNSALGYTQWLRC